MKNIVYIFFIFLLITSCTSYEEAEEVHNNINIQKSEKLNKKKLELSKSEIKINKKYKETYKNEINLISKILYEINKNNFGDHSVVKGHLVESNLSSIYVDPLNNIIIPSGFLEIFNYKNGFDEKDFSYIICHEFSHIMRDDWSRNVQSSAFDKFVRFFNPSFFVNITPVIFTKKGATKAEVKAEVELNPTTFYKGDMHDKSINNLDIFKFTSKHEISADIESIECLSYLGVNYRPSDSLYKLYELNKKIQVTDEVKLLSRINEVKKHEN